MKYSKERKDVPEAVVEDVIFEGLRCEGLPKLEIRVNGGDAVVMEVSD